MASIDLGLGAPARGGLVVAGLAGLLLAVAPALGDLAQGDGPGGAEVTLDLPVQVAVLGAVCGVLMIAAAIGPWLAAQLGGLALAGVVVMTSAFLIVGARGSDDFAEDASVSLAGAGTAVLIAFIVAVGGIVIALVGVTRAGGEGRTASRPALAIALSLVGIVLYPLTAPAAAIAALMLHDGELAGRDRRLALVALVVAVVLFTIFTTFFVVQMVTADPG
jgi:hypothetical protein